MDSVILLSACVMALVMTLTEASALAVGLQPPSSLGNMFWRSDWRFRCGLTGSHFVILETCPYFTGVLIST